jgi:hypothetical protein
MVINLKPLNFETESLPLSPPLPRLLDILPALDHSGRLLVIDLKDAFYCLAYKDTRRDLRTFGMASPGGEQRVYTLRCLAMGWSNSPAMLVKLTEPFMAEIRSWVSVCLAIIYLDDLLITVRTKAEGKRVRKRVLDLLLRLGFVLKEENPMLKDSDVYLGTMVDLRKKELRLTSKKLKQIREQAQRIINNTRRGKGWVCLEDFRSFVGRAQSATMVISIGKSYLRHAYNDLYSPPEFRDGCVRVRMSKGAQRDVTWWTNLPCERKFLYSRPFLLPRPTIRIWYDASRLGFGIVLEATATRPELIIAGKWTVLQKMEHITSLEGRAGFLALEAWTKNYPNGESSSNVQLELVGDSFSVVSAFTKQTSPSTDIMRSIRKIASLQLTNNFRVQHAWIPTNDNKADWPSRLRLEESYRFRFATRLSEVWGVKLEIDRFASYFNRQTPRYNSLLRSPDSEGNAWEANWKGDNQFFNPPFSQIERVIQKMLLERAGGILIVPAWQSRKWYPLLQGLFISKRVLYQNVSLYINEAGELLPSPSWGTWALRVMPS